jgi:spermidine synthase
MRPQVKLEQQRAFIYLLVICAGSAALSWEAIWQLYAALALGVSAQGTAITLCATMGGICAGSLCAGRYLRSRKLEHPLRTYGVLEGIVGLSGLLLKPAFLLLERVDSAVYPRFPEAALMLHLFGIVIVLGPPTLAMGATIPLFGLVARNYRTSIALLYGLNTFGAGIGVLLAAFALIPAIGVYRSSLLISGLNLLVFLTTRVMPRGECNCTGPDNKHPPGILISSPVADAVVLATGFATFALEVAWFRALRAAFFSTTQAFAIMLAAVLLPLAAAAAMVPYFQQRKVSISHLLGLGGVVVLLVTPLVERFDMFARFRVFYVLPTWFLQSIAVIGPAMFLLGLALPWILEQQQSPRAWARLYATNTLGAIGGAIASAWLFLPSIGFARTAWLISGLAVGAALLFSTRRERVFLSAMWGLCLLIAVLTEAGVGQRRTLGTGFSPRGLRLVDFEEGPDSTVSAVEDNSGVRTLYIDGFAATTEAESANYMAWMGRLPMILHEHPRQALVICFGTGQTANAVRQEGAAHMDVVDISPAVFKMASLFPSNQGVLEDPRASAIVMDGRAWLRRTTSRYDIITLEPMPPTFAGVNALYSKEFYELARQRLTPGGIIAQWLPFHLVKPVDAGSIAATFRSVFPNSMLWLDPVSHTGILLGQNGADNAPIGSRWPGISRFAAGRNLEPREIVASVYLDPQALERYSAAGKIITDDNQLLAYAASFERGVEVFAQWAAENHNLVEQARHSW